MSEITINLDYGKSKRLLTQNKLCKENIVVTATEANMQYKTATPSTSVQTIEPDEGYDGLSSVSVSAMPKTTQATPTLEVDSDGLVTAMCTQTAGYVDEGTVIGELQLTRQAGKTVTPQPYPVVAVQAYNYTTGQIVIDSIQRETATVTPTAVAQTVTPSSGKYFSSVTVNGDENLVAENIKSGVSIFGVAGTMTGEGIDVLHSATILGCEAGNYIDRSVGGFSLQGLDYFRGNIMIAISSDFNTVAVWNGISGQCDYVDQGGELRKMGCTMSDSCWLIDDNEMLDDTTEYVFIYLEKVEATLITFSVQFHDGSVYSFNAEAGMTFNEFVVSDYNINEEDSDYVLVAVDNYVVENADGYQIRDITINTVIENGATYYSN